MVVAKGAPSLFPHKYRMKMRGSLPRAPNNRKALNVLAMTANSDDRISASNVGSLG
jgi:hypothetical protein